MDIKLRAGLVQTSPGEPPAYNTSSSVTHQHEPVGNFSLRDEGQTNLYEQSTRSTASPPPEFSVIPTDSDADTILTPPEQYADKLHTNYIPSSPEINDIKQFIGRVNEEVSSYDHRIAELQAALQQLTRKRDALEEIATVHEALISPIRRLPPEILQSIFIFCLPKTRNAVMHASEAPVLLGRICSEWRRISLATPEVWSSLHIVPPHVNFSNPKSSLTRYQRKMELIDMWLKRTGACPLSISFVWIAGDSEEEIELCGILLQAIRPVCARWKTLEFQLPLKMFKPFVGLTVNDVPLLEGISLMDNRTPLDTDAVDCWPDSLNFLENATKLKAFTLTFFSGGIRLPSIPWSQLIALYLESNICFFFSDAKEMLSVLGACKSLQSCTLKFPLSHTTSLPSFRKVNMPIALPQLLVLCLDGDQHLQNTFHMSNTLMNLITPRLKKLEIFGRSGRLDESLSPDPVSAIRTLLERSRCPLERLYVESIPILPEVFIECLRLAPSLKDLKVHNWAVRLQSGGFQIEGTPEVAVDVADGSVGGATANESIVTNSVHMAEKEEESAENQVLKALTIKRTLPRSSPTTIESSVASSTSVSQTTPISISSQPEDDLTLTLCPTDDISNVSPPICPHLQTFDFILGDASQSLMCDFIASRWEDVPAEGILVDCKPDSAFNGLLDDRPHDTQDTTPSPGAIVLEGIQPAVPVMVSRIKTVKCTFTAYEDETSKKRIQRFKTDGLDAQITFQVPSNDDITPSPWTGLDVAP